MGCCLSKHNSQTQTQTSLKPQQPQLKSNPTHELAPPSPSPPPPPPSPPPPFEEEEEESVKEVLSETPISKPHQVPILATVTRTQMPLLQNPVEVFETKDLNPIISEPNQVSILTTETMTQMPLLQNPVEVFEPEKEVTELVSQPSEACSISESFSTTTTATAATEKREEDEATSEKRSRERITTTTNHKWNRSPSNASSRKGPYAVNGNGGSGGRGGKPKSPAKRSEPSPEKKIQSGSRSVRGRESGQVANRKVNNGLRRDSGEGSGRRSRSPSCTRTASGINRLCGDGDRKEVAPVNGVAEKEEKRESEEVGEKNDVVTQEESIENPHVSMECFIFL